MTTAHLPDDLDTPLAPWRRASEAGDADALIACLAPEVVLISPLTAAYRFEGREHVGQVMREALRLIPGIRFHTDIGDATTRVVVFTATIDGLPLEEAQLHRLDADGRIVEITLFGRPLPAVTAIMAKIGPALLRGQGRSAMAAVVAAGAAPMAAMTRSAERRIVPRTDPSRTTRS